MLISGKNPKETGQVMDLPTEIRVRVVLGREETPLPEVAVLVNLIAPKKNKYSVGPKLTDSLGEAIFTMTSILGEIAEMRRQFPMDYSSSIHECANVEAKVLDRDTSIG